MSASTPATTSEKGFDFPFSSLSAWVVRRRDGSVTKYVLDTPTREKIEGLISSGQVKRTPAVPVTGGLGSNYNPKALTTGYTGNYYSTPPASVSAYCAHNGDDLIYEGEGIKLFICDATGARKAPNDKYDLIIDGGNVVTDFAPRPILYGDVELAAALRGHSILGKHRRTLKIDWADRMEPDLHPKFWLDLTEMLKKQAAEKGGLRVMTCCQGGHGRSGSSLVALMMCLTDYTPLDAVTHLRAMHCARAIESVRQHEYLNWLAEELGRDQNALLAEKVKDFRARFLGEVTSKFAESSQERLEAKLNGGAK